MHKLELWRNCSTRTALSAYWIATAACWACFTRLLELIFQFRDNPKQNKNENKNKITNLIARFAFESEIFVQKRCLCELKCLNFVIKDGERQDQWSCKIWHQIMDRISRSCSETLVDQGWWRSRWNRVELETVGLETVEFQLRVWIHVNKIQHFTWRSAIFYKIM